MHDLGISISAVKKDPDLFNEKEYSLLIDRFIEAKSIIELFINNHPKMLALNKKFNDCTESERSKIIREPVVSSFFSEHYISENVLSKYWKDCCSEIHPLRSEAKDLSLIINPKELKSSPIYIHENINYKDLKELAGAISPENNQKVIDRIFSKQSVRKNDLILVEFLRKYKDYWILTR